MLGAGNDPVVFADDGSIFVNRNIVKNAGADTSLDLRADVDVRVQNGADILSSSNRLALTDHETDAVKIEHDLMPLVPQEDWAVWSHLLIYHGRAVCTARARCEA